MSSDKPTWSFIACLDGAIELTTFQSSPDKMLTSMKYVALATDLRVCKKNAPHFVGRYITTVHTDNFGKDFLLSF